MSRFWNLRGIILNVIFICYSVIVDISGSQLKWFFLRKILMRLFLFIYLLLVFKLRL